MKKIILILTYITVLVTGCKKADKFTWFNMEYHETVIVPASTGISLPFDFFTPEVESNSESAFAFNDTRKDLIEKILLKKLELTIESPSNEDFSFLKSISVFISAEGLNEVKVAWYDNVPANTENSLKLKTSDIDLKEYISKDQFNLRVNTVTDEMLTSDYHIDIFSVFFVDAKLLGDNS